MNWKDKRLCVPKTEKPMRSMDEAQVLACSCSFKLNSQCRWVTAIPAECDSTGTALRAAKTEGEL